MNVTEEDREKARGLVTHRDMCGGSNCTCGAVDEQQDVAAALAAEREKARAPFLALANVALTRWSWTGKGVAAAILRAAE